MEKKVYISFFLKAILKIHLLSLLTIYNIYGQSGVKGNTFIHSSKEMMVFKAHSFVYGGSGLMPGIVCTKRNPPSYLSFSGQASVTSVSDAAHVDGYVKNYNLPVFTFPIGDNGRYCPVSISANTLVSPVMAAYFAADPSIAITSSLLGGMEPPSPPGAPFNTTSLGQGILRVSKKEYWDVNGSSPVSITLHWQDSSSIDSLTSPMLDVLRIVGWDGSKWVDIPSSIQPGSNLETGSITTNDHIIPDSYNVYTFGSSCELMNIDFTGVPDNLYLCKDEQKQILVSVNTMNQTLDNKYVLQVFDGNWKDAETNYTGIFTFDGFPPNINAKKYRVKLLISASCFVYSKEFIHYPYKSVTLACLSKVNLSLDQDCSINVTPAMLLTGSDLSGYYDIEIRDGLGNLKTNPLNQSDAGQSYMVTVREKCGGNSCWSQIFIEDKMKPIAECGEQQVFKCYQLDEVQNERPDQLYANNQATFNHFKYSIPPVISDNCTTILSSFTDRTQIGECGSSTIFRDWKLVDNSGNSAACTQALYFEPLNFDQLILPQKEVILTCGQGTSPEEIAIYFDDEHTEDDPSTPWEEHMEGYQAAFSTIKTTSNDGKTHYQKISPNICNIYATYSDDQLPLCTLGCGGSYKIIRTWTLLNNCNNETTSFTQLIKVMDEKGPEFEVEDTILAINQPNCTSSFKIAAPKHLKDDCSSPEGIKWKISASNQYTISGSHPDYSISGLTIGNHTVFYQAEDCCGNKTELQVTIKVIDSAPMAYCKPLTILWKEGQPKASEILAKSFDIGSTDMCTGTKELLYTFDGVFPFRDSLNKVHFYKKDSMGQIVASNEAEYQSGQSYRWVPSVKSASRIYLTSGQHPIQMDVWDEGGLQDACYTTLQIIDPAILITIGGHIKTENGLSVANVSVTIKADHPQFPKKYQTRSDGKYSFLVPSGLNYTLSAAKSGDYLNGVSTLDLVIIQRHILGMVPHNSGYKVIASDGSDNSKVSAADLVEIRKLILGITDTFTNKSWRFPVSFPGMDIKDPFPYPEHIQVEAAVIDMNNIDFFAVKIGDVDGNATYDVSKANVDRRQTPKQAILGIKQKMVKAGEQVAIPIKAKSFKEVIGFQATLQFKEADYVSIESGVLDITHHNIGVLSDSLVTLSVSLLEAVSYDEGAILFTVILKPTQDATTGDLIQLTSKVTKEEVYFADFSTGRLTFNSYNEPFSIELKQNEPNPFIDQTTISFEAEKSEEVNLKIYDVAGKLVLTRRIYTVSGTNTLVITSGDLVRSGVYFYTLESNGWKETRKMLRLE